MKKIDVVRAWRDEEYYASLTDEERAQLPAHPSCHLDVSDDVLNSVTGGCLGLTSHFTMCYSGGIWYDCQ